MREMRERVSREEREIVTKKYLAHSYSTLLLIEVYYSYVLKLLAYDTCNEVWFLVYGVSNAKNLTFSTPNTNALNLNNT